MLGFLRKSANGFAVKVLMIILLLTFVLWGVGDMFRGSSQSFILKVADKKYDEIEFNKLYRQHLALLQSQINYQFKKEELNDPQLKQIIVNHVVNRLLQNELASEMDLAVSDDMVKFEIAGMQVFNKDGQFNKEIFDEYLKNSGLNETAFIDLVREDIRNKSLNMLFAILRFEPTLLSDTLFKARTQVRTINEITITPANLPPIDSQNDEQLLKFYEANKNLYTTDEKRDIIYAVIDKSTIKYDNSVDDKTLEELYNSHKEMFIEPKKRKVRQLLFKDKNIANKTYNEIKSGKDFDKITKDSTKAKLMDLGEITENSFDEKISQAIFSLPLKTPSKLIESPMGYHIFIVDKILGEKQKSFSQAKEQLKKMYSDEKNFENLSNLAQSIDKEVLASKSLEDIASNYNLKTYKLSNVNKSFDNIINSDSLTKYREFQDAAFSTDEKMVSMVTSVDSSDKSFILAVNKIYPSVIKSINDVKPQLIENWKNYQKSVKFAELVSNIYKDLSAESNDINLVLKKYNITISKDLDLALSDTDNSRNQKYIRAIFQTKEGGYTLPFQHTANNNYNIAFIKKVSQPDIPQDSLKAIQNKVSENLVQNIPNELMSQLLTDLREKYNVEINNKYIEMLEF